MTAAESQNDHLLRLESVISHLQHDVEQMHAVLVSQQSEIQSLRSLIQRFEGQLEDALKEPEKRNLEEERPPHY